MSQRRSFLQRLATLPVLGGLATRQSAFASPATSPARDVIKELGVRTFINAAGTYTALTASLMRPEVVAAMKAASGHFVQYDELAYGVGRRLAEVTGAEWGMVSAGCAAGLKHVTAACVTGGKQENFIRIPVLKGFE